jgi:heat shock protein HslJ
LEQVTIDSPEKYTVELKADGELAVSADCNVGGGTYKINGKSISINITSTTLALCAEGSYGDLFFRSLDGASTYFMEGDNLMIDQFADSGTMRFFE